MIYKNNINYKEEYISTIHQLPDINGKQQPLIYYSPVNPMNYHTSRMLAASAQDTYASCGITQPVLNEILEKMEEAVNKNKLSDVAVWINNLKTRTRYPVDEYCALRMAATLVFIEGEDPNETNSEWTDKKLTYIINDPGAYSFFLPIGLINIPAYAKLLDNLSLTDIEDRKLMLQKLIPIPQ